MKIKMADALERDREAKSEEILLELEDKGRKISLKYEQRKAVKQLQMKRKTWWQRVSERVSSFSCWCSKKIEIAMATLKLLVC